MKNSTRRSFIELFGGLGVLGGGIIVYIVAALVSILFSAISIVLMILIVWWAFALLGVLPPLEIMPFI